MPTQPATQPATSPATVIFCRSTGPTTSNSTSATPGRAPTTTVPRSASRWSRTRARDGRPRPRVLRPPAGQDPVRPDDAARARPSNREPRRAPRRRRPRHRPLGGRRRIGVSRDDAHGARGASSSRPSTGRSGRSREIGHRHLRRHHPHVRRAARTTGARSSPASAPSRNPTPSPARSA